MSDKLNNSLTDRDNKTQKKKTTKDEYIVKVPDVLKKYGKQFDNYKDYIVNIKATKRKYMKSSELADYIVNLEEVKEEYLSQIREEYVINIRNVIEEWKKEPLPEFKIIASPDEDKWEERVKEEIEIFTELVNRYNTFYQKPQFKDLKPKNDRKNIFTCLYLDPETDTYKEFEIKLPTRYPIQRPISTLDDYGKKCLKGEKGGLEGRWRNDGRYGIAHYLAYIIGPLISLEKARIRSRR